MSNTNGNAALARRDEPMTQPLAMASAGFTETEIDIIKTQIAPGVTDGELKLFLHVCKSRRLDPFSKQIYAIRREQWDPDARTRVKKMTIQTGIDGFRLNAKRGGIEAIDDAEFEYNVSEEGPLNPLGLVRAKVSVWRTGVSKPTTASAYWDEYRQVKDEYERNQKTGRQTLSGKWADMPRTMLAKCAEALACRKAAPEELSGLYLQEEMDQADNVPMQPERSHSAKDEAVAAKHEPTAGDFADMAQKCTTSRELGAVWAKSKNLQGRMEDNERKAFADLFSSLKRELKAKEDAAKAAETKAVDTKVQAVDAEFTSDPSPEQDGR